MAHEHGRRTGAILRDERALLLVANAIPLLAYATGSLSFLAALLAYLLEPPIVGAGLAAKLLVLDEPTGERSRRLATLDREWLAGPATVTTWNLRLVARYVGVYALVALFVYGAVALALVTMAASSSASGGFETVSTAWLALVLVGFALEHLWDLGAFLGGHDGRRGDPEAVVDQARLTVHRLYLTSVLFVVFGAMAGLAAVDVVPTLALASFAATKAGVDLLYLPHTGLRA